jgi:hypothetical protein
MDAQASQSDLLAEDGRAGIAQTACLRIVLRIRSMSSNTPVPAQGQGC